MTAIVRVVVVGLGLGAVAAPAQAEGFASGRDAETTFHVKNNPKTYVKFESTTKAEVIKGVANKLAGTLVLNPAKLDKAMGKFTLPVTAIDTGIPTRNEHMRSSEWLDAAQFPDVVFSVTGIEKPVAKGNTVRAGLIGKMSVHGVEKDVVIPAVLVYVKDKRADSTNDTLAITAKFDVKLADYQIKGRAGSIGSKVAEVLKMNVSVYMDTTAPNPETEAEAGKKEAPKGQFRFQGGSRRAR